MARKSERRSAVAHGATAHYEDGRYYDQAYRRRRDDVRFYTGLAERSGGPVLELGAGTGRVALEIAKAGIEVVGVESMRPMLDRAQERVARLPRKTRDLIEFRHGDLERLRLRRRFPLVIAPFNVWMHLYTREQIERGFKTANFHLGKNGRFVLDVLVPDPVNLARDPRKTYRGGTIPHPKDNARYRYSEVFHYDPDTQVQTVWMQFEHPETPSKSFTTPLTQRQFFPAELRALLHYSGFRVEQHLGGFSREPLGPRADSQVIIARRGRK